MTVIEKACGYKGMHAPHTMTPVFSPRTIFSCNGKGK